MNELTKLIASSKGRFFSIRFVSKSGRERLINGKDKYERLLSGGKSTLGATQMVPFVNRNGETWASTDPAHLVHFKCGEVKESFVIKS